MALLDLTLGRFYGADSLVHRLDSRTKLFTAILLMASCFYARSLVSFLLLYLLLIVAVVLSRVPLKHALRNLKFFVWLIALAVLLNLLFTGGTPVARFGSLTISMESVAAAGISLARLVLVIVTASILTLTTAPLDLTDGISRSLVFLQKFKVPVQELSLMSGLALSYVPVLVDEVREISLAQKSRGARLDGKGLRVLRSAVSLLVPVLLSTFRKADRLAQAMEARCFVSGVGRTRLTERKMCRADYLAIVCSLVLVCIALFVAH